VVVSRPPVKYMEEGASGTIAACYHSTTGSGKESISLISGNITWHWMNTTTSIPLPTRPQTQSSTVWSNGFILRGVNVKLQHTGKYCCVVGDEESCTENSTSQLIVTGKGELYCFSLDQLQVYTFILCIIFVNCPNYSSS